MRILIRDTLVREISLDHRSKPNISTVDDEMLMVTNIKYFFIFMRIKNIFLLDTNILLLWVSSEH